MKLAVAVRKLLLVLTLVLPTVLKADPGIENILKVLNNPIQYYAKVIDAITSGAAYYSKHPQYLEALANFYANSSFWASESQIADKIYDSLDKNHQISNAGGDEAWANANDRQKAADKAHNLLTNVKLYTLTILSKAHLPEKALKVLTNNYQVIKDREVLKILLKISEKNPKNSSLIALIANQSKNLDLLKKEFRAVNIKTFRIALMGDLKTNRWILLEGMKNPDIQRLLNAARPEIIHAIFPDSINITGDYIPGKLEAVIQKSRVSDVDVNNGIISVLLDFAKRQSTRKTQVGVKEIESALETIRTITPETSPVSIYAALLVLNKIDSTNELYHTTSVFEISHKFKALLDSNAIPSAPVLKELAKMVLKASKTGLFTDAVQNVASRVLYYANEHNMPEVYNSVLQTFKTNTATDPIAIQILIREARHSLVAMEAIERVLPFREESYKMELRNVLKNQDNQVLRNTSVYQRLVKATDTWTASTVKATCNGISYTLACGKGALSGLAEYCKNLVVRSGSSK